MYEDVARRGLLLLMLLGPCWCLNECYECTNGEWTDFCESTETVTRCRGGESACFNQVRNENGILKSWKGCSYGFACLEQERRNPPGCKRGIVETTCHWCCMNNTCNEDILTYYMSEPPPTEPMSTTTAVSRIDALAEMAKCLQGYKKEVLVTIDDPKKHFGAFCNNVPDVFHCLATVLAQTCDLDSSDLPAAAEESLVALATSGLRSACPSVCSPPLALKCSTDVTKRILRVIVERPSCKLLHREIVTTRRCVAHSTYNCDASTTTVYSKTVSAVSHAVELVCDSMGVARSTPAPSGAPTESTTASTTVVPETTTAAVINCPNLDKALDCLAKVGDKIQKTKTEDGDFTRICNHDLNTAFGCARAYISGCEERVVKRVELAITYITGLLEGRCDSTESSTTVNVPESTTPKIPEPSPTPNIPGGSTLEPVSSTPAPEASSAVPSNCDTKAARTCIVELWTLIEQVKDFEKACRSLESTKKCVEDHSIGCSEKEKNSLKSTLRKIIEKIGKRCDEVIKCPAKETIVIEEGGETKWVDFRFIQPPSSLCTDCKVYLDILPETTAGPHCRSQLPISQLIVGGGEHEDNHCAREITAENWQKIHRFSLTAKIDFKSDGNQKRKVILQLRKVKDGRIVDWRTLCEFEVIIIDRDLSTDTCLSYNDPHLKTFDGVMYNNMLSGFFTLYRHKTLPYEVQVAYSQCQLRATCNCAAAIRSGDSVFVVDRCNRRSRARNCHSHRYYCGAQPQDVRMYFRDRVTPGTRVFRRRGGLQYDVILPHGTRVSLTITGNQINVKIVASPYDRGQVEGLCGHYDGDRTNDFVLPDGSVYRGRQDRRKERRPFSAAWRVATDELIFYAAGAKTSYSPPRYCECRPTIDNPDGQSASYCGPQVLLETCDLNEADEVTYRLPRRVDNNVLQHQNRWRGRRQAADPYADWAVEDSFEGPPPENWEREDAERFCANYIQNSPLVRMCMQHRPQLKENVMELVDSCTEDVMLSGGTTYAQTSLEVAKAMCLDDVRKDVGTAAGRDLLAGLEGMDCPEDCNANGRCVNGSCACAPGHRGPSCAGSGPAVPDALLVEDSGRCRLRETDCGTAVVYGRGFELAEKATCHFTPTQVDGLPTASTKSHTSKAFFLSDNQVLCSLPQQQKEQQLLPYNITVSNDGSTPAAMAVTFVPYDVTCYDCDVTEEGVVFCKRKENTCIIEGRCFGSDEQNPEDTCRVCKPEETEASWSDSYENDCQGGNRLLIIILCVIFVFLILFTILLVVCYKRVCGSKRKGSDLQRTREGNDRHVTELHIDINNQKGEDVPLSQKNNRL